MRRFLISLLLVLLAVAAPQRVLSQSADTSDLFLNAFMANEAGEKLENSGDTGQALSKYRYAASLLDQISRDDPKWNPIVVDYRKRKVGENITRLQQKAAAEGPAPEASSVPLEGELPQKEPPGSDMGTSTVPVAPPSGGISQQVRDQLDELQNDLRDSQKKLKSVENEKEGLAGRLDDALKQLDTTKISVVELKGQVKQAQDAYQNSLTDHSQTAAGQKELQTRVTQLQDALKNAEADRDAATAQSDDAARRAKARDTSEAELKDQLKQAQDELAAHGQPDALQKQYQARISQLQDALKNAEADRDAATEQNDQDARRTKARDASEAELKDQLKQTQDALAAAQAHPDAAQKQAQTRIAQLEDALKSAEADRDAAATQNDDAARRAAKARQTAEATATDLKTQLQQAQDALAAAKAQPEAAQKQAQTRIAQLEDALKSAEADREAANEQNEEYARRAAKAHQETEDVAKQRDAATAHAKDMESKYADASKLASQLQDANQKIADLTKDRDDATQRADDLEKKLADTSKTVAKLADAQKEIAALKATDADATQKNSDLTAKLTDAQKQIDQLTADRDTAKAQVTALDGKLADAQKEIATVKADRDTIASQRDQALADLAKAKQAQKRVDQLIAENTTLSQKLAADELTIQNFKSDSPEKDKQIADLRKEVSDTKALLATTQQDRDNVQSTLNDLQQQYDTTTAQLAELKADTEVNASEKKTLTDENDLLRGIVTRHLKQQAKRDQAKRMVMTELAQLQVQSDTLLKNIEYLGEPVLQLTDKEKALFKDPSLDIPDADESTMDISIAAPKQGSAAHSAAPVTAATDDAGAAKTSADPGSSPAPDGSPSAPPVTSVSAPSATPMELASRTNPGSPESALSSASAPGAEQPETGSEPSGSAADKTAGTPPIPHELLDQAKAAKDAFEKSQFREAERIYEKMLTKAPNNVYILSNLGVAYFRDQKWNLAEESLKKAVAVAPEDVFSWCTLGIVYYQEGQQDKGRFDDAINALTRALAINPKYAVAHNYLGITASQKGWQEAAKKELETAVEYDPNYADAYFNLAVVYATEKPPEKELAAKYYKRATDLGEQPDSGLDQLVK